MCIYLVIMLDHKELMRITLLRSTVRLCVRKWVVILSNKNRRLIRNVRPKGREKTSPAQCTWPTSAGPPWAAEDRSGRCPNTSNDDNYDEINESYQIASDFD